MVSYLSGFNSQVSFEELENLKLEYSVSLALDGLKKNPQKNASSAEQLLLREVNEGGFGVKEARYLLALLYLYAPGDVVKDIDKALLLLKQCDSAQANYVLALLYLDGLHGVPQDKQLGLTYLTRAAEQGSLLAETRLGLSYWTGAEGNEKDPQKATAHLLKLFDPKVYQKYVSKISETSRLALAEFGAENLNWCAKHVIESTAEKERTPLYLRFGIAVFKRNRDNISALYNVWENIINTIPSNRSPNLDEKRILTLLGRVYYNSVNGFGYTNSYYSSAVRHWKRAAEADYPMAQYYLGLALCSGKGIKRDIDAGKDWLKKASESKFLPATLMLRQLSGEKGLEVPLDFNEEDNPLKVAPLEERDCLKSLEKRSGKVWSWFKNHSTTILIVTISIVAVTAILAGLAALTFFFPMVMVPIWIGTGLIIGSLFFAVTAFAAGAGDRGAQRTLGWLR